MRNGFVKVMACSPEIRVADCGHNLREIISLMQKADRAGADVLLLPELCVTGYTCGDLFLQQTLICGAEKAIEAIIEASGELSLTTIVGAPFLNEGKLYNCAFVISRGELLGIVPKSSIPNYAEYCEVRYFAAAPNTVYEVSVSGHTCKFGADIIFVANGDRRFSFAVELCEDLLVTGQPSIRHAKAGAAIIFNLSAGDELVGKAESRREIIKVQSALLNCGYVYANAGIGESTSDMVFAGHCLIAECGKLLCENELFSMETVICDIDIEKITHERMRKNNFTIDSIGYEKVAFDSSEVAFEFSRKFEKLPFVPSDAQKRSARCEDILTMQAHGLARRISHTNAKCAVIGISGGLDSCLALLVTVRAFDLIGRSRAEIHAVTMPCFGTTSRTRSNAEKLCEKLGVSFRCVDISNAVTGHFSDIGHDADKHDVTFENSQARERTQVLMDIANAEGGLVVGTGDLSELVLGWATYNGDHMSMYGVNASIPKTLVRYLVAHCADTCGDAAQAEVLRDIVDTPVSPELLPHNDGEIVQKTEDLVGPYELHDFFLYYMLRFGFAPSRIFTMAKIAFGDEYDDETILKWLKIFCRRFFAQQFKRSCLPDGAKVGTVSVSPRGDLKMPSDACASLWLAELDALGK